MDKYAKNLFDHGCPEIRKLVDPEVGEILSIFAG